MKIYGDYGFLLDKLNVRNHSQVQVFQNGTKIVEFADQFIESQKAVSKDAVTISREGMDYLRDSLADLNGSNGVSFPEDGYKLVMGDGLSLMDGLCRNYIVERLDYIDSSGASSNLYTEMKKRYEDEMALKSTSELKDHAESLARVHLDMQEKIREGYENGTREVWVLDNSTGEDFSGVEFEIDGHAVRYRKLTMEEELESMEKAFGELKTDIVTEIAKDRIKDTHISIEVDEKDDGTWTAEDEFWKMKDIVEDLLEELDQLITKIEAMFKKKEKVEDIGARLAEEMKNHGVQTVANGQRQVQCANYRKMSRMTMDVQGLSILKNIKA